MVFGFQLSVFGFRFSVVSCQLLSDWRQPVVEWVAVLDDQLHELRTEATIVSSMTIAMIRTEQAITPAATDSLAVRPAGCTARLHGDGCETKPSETATILTAQARPADCTARLHGDGCETKPSETATILTAQLDVHSQRTSTSDHDGTTGTRVPRTPVVKSERC